MRARVDLLHEYFETFSATHHSIMDIAKTDDLENRYFIEDQYSITSIHENNG